MTLIAITLHFKKEERRIANYCNMTKVVILLEKLKIFCKRS